MALLMLSCNWMCSRITRDGSKYFPLNHRIMEKVMRLKQSVSLKVTSLYIILNHDFSADLERSSSLMVWHYLDPDPMLVRYTVLGRPEFPAVHREFAGLR